MGQTVHGNKHRRTGLEVLLQSCGGGSSSKLGPESLEDAPGDSRIIEAKLGEVFEGGGRLQHLQIRVLLGDLQASEKLPVGLDGASQQS